MTRRILTDNLKHELSPFITVTSIFRFSFIFFKYWTSEW